MTRTARPQKRSHEAASSWEELRAGPRSKAAAQRADSPEGPVSVAAAEKRRAARRLRRLRSTTCFGCRKVGHALADCPSAAAGAAKAICYHCGSEEHTTKACTRKEGKNYEFALCFVCKRRGHLASVCPENAKGLYPDGGGCKYCGSVAHLAKDCRPNKQAAELGGVKLGRASDGIGADEDETHLVARRISADKAAAKRPAAPSPATQKPRVKVVSL